MRRVLGILLNAATVLSLVLCVATIVLWIRSFYVQDHLFWLTSKSIRPHLELTTYDLYAVKGRAVLQVQTKTYNDKIYNAQAFADALAMYAKLAPNGYRWRTSRPPFGYHFNYHPDGYSGPRLARAGFRFAHSMRDADAPFPGFTEARLPHWVFVLATAILPGLWLIGALRERRRAKQGLCRTCGYDLRATPDRCPECGTVLTK